MEVYTRVILCIYGKTGLANQHFYSTLLGRREGVCTKNTLDLYACKNAENYGWSLTKYIHTLFITSHYILLPLTLPCAS